jgi:tRNA-(ms[2]io[6]A)-hydroxylase
LAISIYAIFIDFLWKVKRGHYTLFIELAETYIDKVKVRTRWKQWLEHEGKVMEQLTVRGDRMH